MGLFFFFPEKQGWSTYLPAALPAEGAQQKPLPEGQPSLGQAQGAAALPQCRAAAMPRPEQLPGARGPRPRGSWVPVAAQAGTTGHTGSLHSGEAHGQVLHLQKKNPRPWEFAPALIISSGCCTEFSTFPSYISRTPGTTRGQGRRQDTARQRGPRGGFEEGGLRKTRGESLLGTCLRLQMNSDGERYRSKEPQREQQWFKGAWGLQPFFPPLLHTLSGKENTPGSHSLHSCSTGAPTDEFLALGRFIQGCLFFFSFCLKGRLGKWGLFYLTRMYIALTDVRHHGVSQVHVLLLPALQPLARNVLGTGKFLSHRHETWPGQTQTPRGSEPGGTSCMQRYKTLRFVCQHHLPSAQGQLRTHELLLYSQRCSRATGRKMDARFRVAQ